MKLDIGCGFRKRPGFITMDINPDCKPDYLLDLSGGRLPFKDNSIDEIYSYYAFEFIDDILHLLKELCRVSRDGAVWNIHVPYWSAVIGRVPGHKNYFNEAYFDSLDETSKHNKFLGLCIKVEKVSVIRGRFRFWRKYTIHYRLRIMKNK